MDAEGLDLDALAAALDRGPRPAFVYTIPTFQNPSGRTLGLDRRRGLVELVRARGVTLLEDDPYRLVRFDGEPLPTMHELAGGEGVVHASSFSKTVAPGLRVGYAVLPEQLVGPVEAAAVASYITPVLLGQATVWEFIRRGRSSPNVERVRALLRARRDAMLAALERDLPEGTTGAGPRAAISSGPSSESTPPTCSLARPTPAWRSSRGRTSSRPTAERPRRGSPYSYVSPEEIGEAWPSSRAAAGEV